MGLHLRDFKMFCTELLYNSPYWPALLLQRSNEVGFPERLGSLSERAFSINSRMKVPLGRSCPQLRMQMLAFAGAVGGCWPGLHSPGMSVSAIWSHKRDVLRNTNAGRLGPGESRCFQIYCTIIWQALELLASADEYYVPCGTRKPPVHVEKSSLDWLSGIEFVFEEFWSSVWKEWLFLQFLFPWHCLVVQKKVWLI